MRLSERAAVTLLFFLNGAIFSSFFARLPAIKADLGASDGELGVALFFATGGLVVAQPLAGAMAAKLGARWPSLIGLAVYALGLPVAAAAPSVAALAAVLFVMGLANGVLDVAMNVEGVAVERRRGRRVLSSMHAAFSFGGMTGAGLGGLAAAAGLDAEVHLAVVAGLMLVGGAVAATGLPAPRPDRSRARAFVRPDRRLALLGAVAFCVLLAEGSVTDWSAVYLNEGTGASEGLAAAGLSVFSLTMAIGRLAGDRTAERFSAPAVIRAGTLLAATGLGLGLAVAEPALGIAGYALMGIGLSACFPLVIAASARGSGDAEAASIAIVSGAGYVGLTAGPATIGLLSDAVGLRQALLLVVALALVASALAGAARADASRAGS
ncbi:MAG TPA: MFS transporter [Thermoleophilaceae bacterium]|nr:MFS transporter [Thermoleophilaceae bacterium]